MSQRDFRLSLEEMCEQFHHLSHTHTDATHRVYYQLYYEIVCGYLVTDRDLRPLIANMVKQIDVRVPWAHGAEHEVLHHVREVLLLVMEKDPLTKQIAVNSPIY